MVNLKSDYGLVSRLYIASQFREADTKELFAHENHAWPPSLSEQGKLHLPTKKSDLLQVFKTTDLSESYACDVKVVDGAVVVHSLPINDASTFEEYAERIFKQWIK